MPKQILFESDDLPEHDLLVNVLLKQLPGFDPDTQAPQVIAYYRGELKWCRLSDLLPLPSTIFGNR